MTHSGKYMEIGQSAAKSYAYLLGVFLGDGSVSRGRYAQSTIDKDFADAVVAAFADLSDCRVCVSYQEKPKKDRPASPIWNVSCGDKALAERLVADTKGKTIIPDYVHAWDDELRKQFVIGLMDSEGFVAANGNGRGYNWKRTNRAYYMGYKSCDIWVPDLIRIMEGVGLRIGKISQEQPRKPGYKTPTRFHIKMQSWINAGMRFNIARKQDRVDQWAAIGPYERRALHPRGGPQRFCAVPLCGHKHLAKGLCNRHYKQAQAKLRDLYATHGVYHDEPVRSQTERLRVAWKHAAAAVMRSVAASIALIVAVNVTEIEWQIDALAAAAQNRVIEGDDATTDVGTATTRRGNYTQISDKVPRVTGTQEVVSKAGRRSEMAHQIMKRSFELKTDIENDLCANASRAAGSDSVARGSAGLVSWIATNESVGTGGSAPTGDGTNTRTAGTARTFEESMMLSVSQQIFVAGGNPDCIMLGAFNKRRFSTFQGNATRNVGAADRKLFSAIDVYETDFGDIEVVVNRFQPAGVALILEKKMWAFASLRPFRLVDLAKDGDSDRKQLLIEFTLEARNQAASGIVADLSTA